MMELAALESEGLLATLSERWEALGTGAQIGIGFMRLHSACAQPHR